MVRQTHLTLDALTESTNHIHFLGIAIFTDILQKLQFIRLQTALPQSQPVLET